MYVSENICKLSSFSEQSSNSDILENIKCFQNYIEQNRSSFDLEKIDQTRSVSLDMQDLLNNEEFKNKWSTFQNDVFEKPDVTLRILEFCLHEVT